MKKELLHNIKDWVNENKKFFWKHEVSSYYPTYKINVANLPKPSDKDIRIQSSNRLFRNSQMLNIMMKSQLCDIIKKTHFKEKTSDGTCINIKIDYVKGAVIVAFI